MPEPWPAGPYAFVRTDGHVELRNQRASARLVVHSDARRDWATVNGVPVPVVLESPSARVDWRHGATTILPGTPLPTRPRRIGLGS